MPIFEIETKEGIFEVERDSLNEDEVDDVVRDILKTHYADQMEATRAEAGQPDYRGMQEQWMKAAETGGIGPDTLEKIPDLDVPAFGLFGEEFQFPRRPTSTEEAPATRVEKAMLPMFGGSAAAAGIFGTDVGVQAMRSVINAAIGLPEFFTTKRGASLGLAGLAAPGPVAGYFTYDLLKSGFEQSRELQENWPKMTPSQRADAIVNLVATGGFAFMTGRHTTKSALKSLEKMRGVEQVPVTPTQRTAGITRQEAEPGPGALDPVEHFVRHLHQNPGPHSLDDLVRMFSESLSPKQLQDVFKELISSKRARITEEGKFELAPEEAAPPTEGPESPGEKAIRAYEEQVAKEPKLPYEEEERIAITEAERRGRTTRFTDRIDPKDPNIPFARHKANAISWVSGGNVININRANLHPVMDRIPKSRVGRFIESLMDEEDIHIDVERILGTDLKTGEFSKKFADEKMAEYWNDQGNWGKWLVERRYFGLDRYTGKRLTQITEEYSDAQMGAEAIRGRLQQLARMEPREVAQAVGLERWKLKGIYQLEALVFELRKLKGDNPRQVALLDKIQENIGVAKRVAHLQVPRPEDEGPPTMAEGKDPGDGMSPEEHARIFEGTALRIRAREAAIKAMQKAMATTKAGQGTTPTAQEAIAEINKLALMSDRELWERASKRPETVEMAKAAMNYWALSAGHREGLIKEDISRIQEMNYKVRQLIDRREGLAPPIDPEPYPGVDLQKAQGYLEINKRKIDKLEQLLEDLEKGGQQSFTAAFRQRQYYGPNTAAQKAKTDAVDKFRLYLEGKGRTGSVVEAEGLINQMALMPEATLDIISKTDETQQAIIKAARHYWDLWNGSREEVIWQQIQRLNKEIAQAEGLLEEPAFRAGAEKQIRDAERTVIKLENLLDELDQRQGGFTAAYSQEWNLEEDFEWPKPPPREFQERLIAKFGRGLSFEMEPLHPEELPGFDFVADRLSLKAPADWDMPNADKKILLEYFKSGTGKGFSQQELLLRAIAYDLEDVKNSEITYRNQPSGSGREAAQKMWQQNIDRLNRDRATLAKIAGAKPARSLQQILDKHIAEWEDWKKSGKFTGLGLTQQDLWHLAVFAFKEYYKEHPLERHEPGQANFPFYAFPEEPPPTMAFGKGRGGGGRRRKPKDNSTQYFMNLPPVSKFKEPPPRPGAQESGAQAPMRAEDINRAADQFVRGEHPGLTGPPVQGPTVPGEGELGRGAPAGVRHPRFRDFYSWLQKTVGTVDRAAAQSIWEDSVWRVLLKESGARLMQLRREFDLEGAPRYLPGQTGKMGLGTRQIVDYSPEGASLREKELITEGVSGRQARAAERRAQAEQLEALAARTPTRQELAQLARRTAEEKIATGKATPEQIELLKAPERLGLSAEELRLIRPIRKKAKTKAEKLVEEPTPEPVSREEVAFRARALRAEADVIESGGEPIDITTGVEEVAPRQDPAALGAQRYRALVIARLAMRMMEESAHKGELSRKTIITDDVDLTNARYSGFQDIDDAHLTPNPKTGKLDNLRKLLTSGARTKGRPESETKRLVALVDIKTKELILVSVYNDAGKLLVVDPLKVGIKRARPTRELDRLFLKSYRPHSTILLRDPVKNFMERFEEVAKYENTLAKDLRQAEKEGRYELRELITKDRPLEEVYEEGMREAEEAPEGLRPEETLEELTEAPRGTSVTEGEGGVVTGPQAAEGRALMGIGRGALERAEDIPLRAQEVRALYRTIAQKVGSDEQGRLKIETADDVRKALKGITQPAPGKQVTSAQEWAAVIAFRKVMEQVAEANPLQHSDALYGYTAAEIYRALKATEDLEGFKHDMLEKFSTPERPGTPSPSVMSESGLRELMSEEGRGIPAGPGPGYRFPAREFPARPSAQKLSPAEQANVARIAEERYGLGPGASEAPRTISEMQEAAPPAGGPVQRSMRSAFTMPRRGLQGPVERPAFTMPERKLTGPVAEEPPTMAFFKSAKQLSTETFERVAGEVRRAVSRKSTTEEIYRLQDSLQNIARQQGRWASGAVRSWIKDDKEAPMKRKAAIAILSASNWEANPEGRGFRWVANTDKLKFMIDSAENGKARGADMQKHKDLRDKAVGRRWEKAADELIAIAKYALDHSTDPELLNASKQARKEFAEVLEAEHKHGIDTREMFNYMPGRYQGDVWTGLGINFGQQRVLGMNYAREKAFDNYWQAIAFGPYIPISMDIGTLVEHRIAQGHRRINEGVWLDYFRGVIDPGTGKKVIEDPKYVVFGTKGDLGEPLKLTKEQQAALAERLGIEREKKTDFGLMEPTGKEVPIPNISDIVKETSPGREYHNTPMYDGRRHAWVLEGYRDAFSKATNSSALRKTRPIAELLKLNQRIKHELLLAYDFFHVGRIAQYHASIVGLNFLRKMKAPFVGLKNPFKGGYSALEFRPSDLDRAVRQGYITRNHADWALKTVVVRQGNETRIYTHSQILDEFLKNGLNVADNMDALFRAQSSVVPGSMRLNRWLFRRMIPGMMAEASVKKFLEYNQKFPNTDATKLIRDIAMDVNIFYGNLGRQGFIKNATIRDFAQGLFLAPGWVESLIQKEVRFPGRVAQAAFGTAKWALGGGKGPITGVGRRADLPPMGVVGSGMARGLIASFLLAQALNYISKGHSTFENEEGHKLDAWIPIGDGFWFSPLTTFMEVLHDFIRLAESRPRNWDALHQIGRNKLSVFGRMAYVLAYGQNPRGEYITTSTGIGLEALKTAASGSIPIIGSTALQTAGHYVTPEAIRSGPLGGLVEKPPPGSMGRQVAASAFGTKIEPAETKIAMVSKMARHFVEEEDLKAEPVHLSPTDEASYSKMRRALRNNDPARARYFLNELRRYHTDGQIFNSMETWAKMPFTGSNLNEGLFLSSLSNEELNLYTDAQVERFEEFLMFSEFMVEELGR